MKNTGQSLKVTDPSLIFIVYPPKLYRIAALYSWTKIIAEATKHAMLMDIGRVHEETPVYVIIVLRSVGGERSVANAAADLDFCGSSPG